MEGHVKVLEWWARSQLDPKYDEYALAHASAYGKVEVLQWWLGSGLPLVFDYTALVFATRNNGPEVLGWDKSGLAINYRPWVIKNAFSSYTDAAREWWRKKGVDFNVDYEELTKLRSFN